MTPIVAFISLAAILNFLSEQEARFFARPADLRCRSSKSSHSAAYEENDSADPSALVGLRVVNEFSMDDHDLNKVRIRLKS